MTRQRNSSEKIRAVRAGAVWLIVWQRPQDQMLCETGMNQYLVLKRYNMLYNRWIKRGEHRETMVLLAKEVLRRLPCTQ